MQTRLSFNTLSSLGKGAQLLLPSVCTLCNRPCKNNICSECRYLLPRMTTQCFRCAEPLPYNSLACGRCLKQKGSVFRTISLYRYDFPITYLLKRFKHSGHLASGEALLQGSQGLINQRHEGQQDEKASSEPLLKLPEILIPVPLHWRRQLHRGFNQAEIICRHWSRTLNIPWHNAVTRKVATPSQQQLTRKQRLRNLRGSFEITQTIPAKRVALIDDVVTTGATGEAIAKLLLKSGVEEVQLWSLAKTAKDHYLG